MPKGEAKIEVSINVDVNGILNIFAKEVSEGGNNSLVIK
jgi:molecular chaperone DnaK (HSP70)